MTLALKMASSMCFSSDLMTHLMLLTTCWTSGGRLQLECSRNFATNILVSLYILRSARECGRSWEECVCSGRGLSCMSTLPSSFCCLLTLVWSGLPFTPSADVCLGSEDKTQQICQNMFLYMHFNRRSLVLRAQILENSVVWWLLMVLTGQIMFGSVKMVR